MVVASQKFTILEIIMKTLTGKERRELKRKQQRRDSIKLNIGLFIFCFLVALCIKFPELTFTVIFTSVGCWILWGVATYKDTSKSTSEVFLDVIDGLAEESEKESSITLTETPTEPSPYQGPEWTSSQLTIPTETKSTSSRQDE